MSIKRNINIKLYDKMRDFFEAPQRFKLLVKGRQVGATISSAYYLIKQCIDYKGRDYLWIDVDYKKIKIYYEKYFYPKLKQLPLNFWSYNAQSNVLKINGNTITFNSDSKPESIEGGTYDLIIINECGFLLKDSSLWKKSLLPMLSIRGGGAIFVGTPKYGKGSYHYELVESIKNNEKDNDLWLLSKITAEDNPYMSDEDRLVLFNELSEFERKTEYYGEFPETTSNAFAKSFDRSKHVKEVPYDNRYIGLSFDFNVGKMSCLVFGLEGLGGAYNVLKNGSKKLIKIYHEFNMINHNTIKDFVIFVSTYLKANSLVPIIITGDATGNSRNINSEMTAYNTIEKLLSVPKSSFYVRSKNLEHVVSAEICNIMLGNHTVSIDKSCRGLIRSCL